MPTQTSYSTPVRNLSLALLGLALCAAAPLRLSAQSQLPAAPQMAGVASANTQGSIAATRTEQAPVIDGLDTDPIWAQAPVQEGFREGRPSEGAQPRQKTDYARTINLRADDGLSGTALDALPLYEVGFRRGASFGG